LRARLADTLKVVDQAKEKFFLYMSHKQRVAQQQDAYVVIDEEMRNEVRENKGNGTKLMLVMDWMMKFETLMKMEPNHEHYRKRGISWHGFFGYYYRRGVY